MILAILTEIRAQKRFKQSNETQEKIAAANIKPLLSVINNSATNSRKVTLHNDGLGPAVIRKATFTKGNRSGNSIPSILEIATGFKWDSYGAFFERGINLRPEDHVDLVVLSADGLKAQGFNDAWVKEIFGRVNNELKEIKISIELEDVLGNHQPDFETTLHY